MENVSEKEGRRAATRKSLRAYANKRLGVSAVTPVAIHEAGHALVAALFGVEVSDISLTERVGNLGSCTTGDWADWRARIVMLEAGYQAHRLYCVAEDVFYAWAGALGDRQAIEALLEQNLPSKGLRRRERARLTRIAKELVRTHWSSIVDVAALAIDGEFEDDYQINFKVLAANGFTRSAINAFRREFSSDSQEVFIDGEWRVEAKIAV